MKNLSKLGKTLSKVEQKEVFGGRQMDPEFYNDCTGKSCSSNADCCGSTTCLWGTNIEAGANEFDVHQVGGGPNWTTEQRCR